MKSLYQCFNAKVNGQRIKCSAGHRLNEMSKEGDIHIRGLEIGRPLELASCQKCLDYDEMGGPVPPEERGWMKSK